MADPSNFAIQTLANLAVRPSPRQDINPGLANKLVKEGLAENVAMPSPFDAHKGKDCDHLQITDAGRRVVAQK